MPTVRKLHDEAEIEKRVSELAGAIAGALPKDFIVVCVLKGGFVFAADLVRALDRAGRTPEIEFIRLGSYGMGTESASAVNLIGGPPKGVKGRAVLLVDDIADTGRSLLRACELLAEAGAAKVWTCVLADKPARREVEVTPDFVGFTVPNAFVVGYGIDLAEKYRQLPYLGVVE